MYLYLCVWINLYNNNILQLYSNVNWDYPKVSSDHRLIDQTDEESEQLFRKTYLFLFKKDMF